MQPGILPLYVYEYRVFNQNKIFTQISAQQKNHLPSLSAQEVHLFSSHLAAHKLEVKVAYP